ncbi:MAG TPA: hypothetical protein PKX38_06905 [Alphaproteobacteria bacterium]|nr:hypothetical protein [Micavibrio sp.]MBK9563612.1 hypothetical protein [Micavibrio sp.]HQX27649.1 hypothetical protein [Alphaproteobacteria bacterium]
MKKLFYSFAHAHSPRQKRILVEVEPADAYDRYMSQTRKEHSHGVYETVDGQILPATHVDEEIVPADLFFKYTDYKDMKAEIIDEKTSCLLTNGGLFTKRGREVAAKLGITGAEEFKKLARDNMHFREHLKVIYVTTSSHDPERRELVPSP